jgi:ribosome-binding protein aMBF1 (putative translation factor)
MVDTIKCELCGVETRYYVTKEIDGRELNFCCKGCQQVFEIAREESFYLNKSNGGEKNSNEGLTSDKEK